MYEGSIKVISIIILSFIAHRNAYWAARRDFQFPEAKGNYVTGSKTYCPSQ